MTMIRLADHALSLYGWIYIENYKYLTYFRSLVHCILVEQNAKDKLSIYLNYI